MVKFVAARSAPAGEILTYLPLPYWGGGPGHTCVSLLEHMPKELFGRTLILPKLDHPVPDSIEVRQTISFLRRHLAYNYQRELPPLNKAFKRLLAAAAPGSTIAHFWPEPPLELIRTARSRGLVTIREMINNALGTVKTVLDEAYDRHGLQPAHGITDQRVQQEKEELSQYDYVFASNPLVETSLLDAGVAKSRIISSTFGWTPSRFPVLSSDRKAEALTVLFVGIVGVRKGVPELLSAWKKSAVRGELILAGPVEGPIKPLLARYVDGGSVRVMNFVQDVRALYRSAHIFAFPTLEEGGPQVTYEAAGCGLPIITTPMGAARLVKDEISGLIVEPADVDGLAEAITRLARSAELRERLGNEASLSAHNFTFERVGIERAHKLSLLLRDQPTP